MCRNAKRSKDTNELICLRRFQAVLVTVVLLAAFGNDGHRLNFGIQDFLGVGTSLGLALATPLILMAYLFGGSLLVMVRPWKMFNSDADNVGPCRGRVGLSRFGTPVSDDDVCLEKWRNFDAVWHCLPLLQLPAHSSLVSPPLLSISRLAIFRLVDFENSSSL